VRGGWIIEVLDVKKAVTPLIYKLVERKQKQVIKYCKLETAVTETLKLLDTRLIFLA
jgi:hypothetical protein